MTDRFGRDPSARGESSSVATTVVDRAGMEAIVCPRRSVVLEAELPPQTADPTTRRFEAARGPFAHYLRTVEVTPQGERFEVRQSVHYRLAVPIFGWLFRFPIRSVLHRTEPPKRSPWWAPPDPIDRSAAAMLAALAVLTAAVTFPSFLFSQTLTFAAEEFGADTQAQGLAGAAVRADVLVAMFLVALADRRGRRRVTLASVAAGCTIVATSALSPSLIAFTAVQVLGRGCLTAAVILIAIMAAEEMPAGSRAYAVSILSVSGALGAGPVLLLLPIADVGERTWRVLFAVALVGVAVVWRVSRHLPESRRFRTAHVEVPMTGHGRRFWLLGASALLFALFIAPASQFQNEFLRNERGFSAARISLFAVSTNMWGGIGIFVGGYLADVRGRRIVGAVGVAGGVGATVLMFLSAGWGIWAWSVLGAIFGALTVPALGVYGPELFPTSLRGKANGFISAMGRIGSVVGLVAAGFLSQRMGMIGGALTLLAIGPAIVIVLILTLYPETAHRELEDLNPEDLRPSDEPHPDPI